MAKKGEGAPVGRPPIRPSVDDPDAVARLCERLAAGASMREVCVQQDVPSSGAIYQRLAIDPEFRSVIGRAREAQADANVDEIIELADAATPENWQVMKLRIHARQWRATKLAPKIYGDRSHIDHTIKKEAAEMQDDEIDAAIAAEKARRG